MPDDTGLDPTRQCRVRRGALWSAPPLLLSNYGSNRAALWLFIPISHLPDLFSRMTHRHGAVHMNFEQLLRENEPLAPMTTLGIGGAARYFADVTTVEALSSGIEWARALKLPHFVLGGGSNIVVADSGFAGLVLRMSIRGIETRSSGDNVLITAGAGEEWDPLVARCVAGNWAGFECLSGIPGRVGATPIQNVGAYGQETSESLTSVQALDQVTGNIVELNAVDCEFGYRTSRFKERDRARFVIAQVTYRLSVNGKPAVRYPELQKYLAERGVNNPSLADVRDAVLTIRRRKAMVIDPSDTDSRSVGSFFVNPVVSIAELERIKQDLSSDDLPAFPVSQDRVKLSAAWLIERAGIARGYPYGNVGTSTKHALAIVNRGGGTAREVIELKDFIQKRVLDLTGIALAVEPVFVGFENSV
ncbi:MAG TPA: UDP-N-acetylmuramate dehydrogenase [Blastocatellia bacterium]|nr:UDP-N-acetylmuramate dehydrogenase [Blastocatellia bacterium]